MLLRARPLVRDNSRETRRRQQALSLLEEHIREQEHAVKRISQELHQAGGSRSYESLNELSWKFAQAQAELEKLTGEWEKLVD